MNVICRAKNKAQASVEYILLIALISGIFIGLMSESGLVNDYLESKKVAFRDKLAGVSGNTETFSIPKSAFAINPLPEVSLASNDTGTTGAYGSSGSKDGAGESDGVGGADGGAGSKGKKGAGGRGDGRGGAGKNDSLDGKNLAGADSGTDGMDEGAYGSSKGKVGDSGTESGSRGLKNDKVDDEEASEVLEEEREAARIKKQESSLVQGENEELKEREAKIASKKKGKLDGLMEDADAENARKSSGSSSFGDILKYIIIILIIFFLIFIFIKSRGRN